MKRSFYIKLIISFAIFAFIFYKFEINFNKLLDVFHEYWYIAITLFFPLFINQVIVNNRWRILLKTVGISEKTWTLIKLNNVSAFIGLILPSSQGYDAIRIYKIEKKYPNNRGIGSTVIIERIIGLVCLCIIGIIASFFIDIIQVKFLIYVFSLILSGILFLIFNNWCFKVINSFFSKRKRFKKFFEYISTLHKAVYSFPLKKNLIPTIFLIFLLQINNTIIVYLLFKATGSNIPFVYHLVSMPIINIISMIPITIGGIGIRDGAFVFMYSLIGIPKEIIVGVSILNYVIVTLIPAGIGGVFYLKESISKK
ncbi:MAG: flippase-like domain-containing protein [Bacteroidales bacterium]|nr:flippase-like domain-containing protein [Bacteroidales bacterium]